MLVWMFPVSLRGTWRLAMYRVRLLMILPLLASAGCLFNRQTLPLPPPLGSVAALEVHQAGPLWLNRLMTAGPWKIRDISRSWLSTVCRQPLLSFSADGIQSRSYSFRIDSQGKALYAACKAEINVHFYPH